MENQVSLLLIPEMNLKVAALSRHEAARILTLKNIFTNNKEYRIYDQISSFNKLSIHYHQFAQGPFSNVRLLNPKLNYFYRLCEFDSLSNEQQVVSEIIFWVCEDGYDTPRVTPIYYDDMYLERHGEESIYQVLTELIVDRKLHVSHIKRAENLVPHLFTKYQLATKIQYYRSQQ